MIETLGLAPHPEGGWYRETWRDTASSAILYLLEEGGRSAWHRVGSPELWHWHAGASVEMSVTPETQWVLGPDVLGGELPQVVVPAGAWQTATPRRGWALVGCTMAPPFTFDAFDLAPPGWEPPGWGAALGGA
jgi:predicted cupin superfamily sugar epimerase